MPRTQSTAATDYTKIPSQKPGNKSLSQATTRDPEINTRAQSDIHVMVEFGAFKILPNGAKRLKTIMEFSGFPATLTDLCTWQGLVGFQKQHFRSTYEHYGLSIETVYGVAAMKWSTNTNSYEKFDPATTQAD